MQPPSPTPDASQAGVQESGQHAGPHADMGLEAPIASVATAATTEWAVQRGASTTLPSGAGTAAGEQQQLQASSSCVQRLSGSQVAVAACERQQAQQAVMASQGRPPAVPVFDVGMSWPGVPPQQQQQSQPQPQQHPQKQQMPQQQQQPQLQQEQQQWPPGKEAPAVTGAEASEEQAQAIRHKAEHDIFDALFSNWGSEGGANGEEQLAAFDDLFEEMGQGADGCSVMVRACLHRMCCVC